MSLQETQRVFLWLWAKDMRRRMLFRSGLRTHDQRHQQFLWVKCRRMKEICQRKLSILPKLPGT